MKEKPEITVEIAFNLTKRDKPKTWYEFIREFKGRGFRLATPYERSTRGLQFMKIIKIRWIDTAQDTCDWHERRGLEPLEPIMCEIQEGRNSARLLKVRLVAVSAPRWIQCYSPPL